MVLGAGTLSVLGAYAAAFLPGGSPPFAPYLLIGGTAAMLVGLMDLGASTGNQGGPAFGIILGTGLWIVAGFVVVLLLPAENPADPRLLLGLPLRAAILIYGVGLAPALVVPWAYAHIFEKHTLSEDQLQALKATAAAVRDRQAATGDPGPDR